MAIEYFVYSDLDKVEVERRLIVAADAANGHWESWGVRGDLGPFHEEIMEEYGVGKGFKTQVYCRHYKEHCVRAREAMLAFFESLPRRKLLLKGDVFVAFRPE
ncbi:MAG: hypothetical protein IOC92_05155 [Rhodobacter sp.]|nr:hypothetical protein [Rhodobacter sp.]MCA3456183.1 hypothetical protein [Rhodobacter sp.]MCA3461510.1 hypothetical protein [Rhodobacter sp.]MCA3464436.1 hypothetical protein [Rhodobacter sp.]MCA3466245.1 hypothetical protein [Rhodobacter sp.]